MTYRIDATNKKIGRIATEVAAALLGKKSPAFRKNIVSLEDVVVANCSKMDIGPRRLNFLTQRRYSGYPGGLKQIAASSIIEKKGHGELLKLIVRGMLPSNTLRPKRLKHLVTKE